MRRYVHGDLVALGEAEIFRLYCDALIGQRPTECLRVAHDLPYVNAAVLLHFAGRDHQASQRVQVMVAGRPGENASIGRPPVGFDIGVFQVGEDHAALGAGKRLVRASGQVGGTFA